jgi:hypothetical protein
MPAFARLLVASACLLIAPLAAAADELPADTSTITSLAAEQARRLVATRSPLALLDLSGLTTLDADAARALAGFEGGDLILNGLTALDAETATALAKIKVNELCLHSLTTLDADTAEALAGARAWDGELPKLAKLDAETAKALTQGVSARVRLGGLTALDAETARALVGSKRWTPVLPSLTALDAETARALAESNGLELDGLATLDAETAKALAAFKGQRLSLNGLQRASLGAIQALEKNPAVSGKFRGLGDRLYLLHRLYLLRYEIAALVGTVLFLALAAFAVWHIRRPRDATDRADR